MIPKTFHFCFTKSNLRWRDIYTLCLRSCIKHVNPHKIVVHYDFDSEGSDWQEAHDLSGIEWRNTTEPITELYRLQTLDKEGGFFCSLDFLFFNSFDKLRHHPAVIGVQCRAKKKLSTALIGAEPGAAFIRAYIDRYDSVNSWTLAQEFPVHIVARPVFFPWCWSNKRFLQGHAINLKKSIAIHLWDEIYTDTMVQDLKQTNIAHIIDDINGIASPSHIRYKAGKTIIF